MNSIQTIEIIIQGLNQLPTHLLARGERRKLCQSQKYKNPWVWKLYQFVTESPYQLWEGTLDFIFSQHLIRKMVSSTLVRLESSMWRKVAWTYFINHQEIPVDKIYYGFFFFFLSVSSWGFIQCSCCPMVRPMLSLWAEENLLVTSVVP